MAETPDDQELVARARDGDRAAFGALVRRYHRRVHAAALHLTGNHGDADDVAQEAMVTAYRGLAGFDGRSDFFTWLYRITINTGLNFLRAEGRIIRLRRAGESEVAHGGGRPEALGQEGKTPREWLELSDRLRRVLAEVCQLSPVLRVTLVLAVVEGLPYKTIAEIMEVPEGTVAWRVNEARKQLRARLGPEREAALTAPADEGRGP
jgi:RNA polymerase sigma-70 factor, ECF subfamily